MQNAERRLYDFDFVGGRDNKYNFKTINTISYNVRFKPNANYVPATEFWRDDLYEIVIEVASTPDPVHIPADPSIFPTVAAIIGDFFEDH